MTPVQIFRSTHSDARFTFCFRCAHLTVSLKIKVSCAASLQGHTTQAISTTDADQSVNL